MEKEKSQKDKKVVKNMSFAEIMENYPKAIEILLEKGMHCIGCPMAMQETLEDGALAHGINPDKLVSEINDALKKEKGE